MKRVFVAGRLSSKEDTNRTPSRIVVDYLDNVHTMCYWGFEVKKLGYAPFIPALDLVLGISCGGVEEEDYRGTSLAFLEVCDAVLVTSMSWGVQKEIDAANRLGIPVFYDMGEMNDYLKRTSTVQTTN